MRLAAWLGRKSSSKNKSSPELGGASFGQGAAGISIGILGGTGVESLSWECNVYYATSKLNMAMGLNFMAIPFRGG